MPLLRANEQRMHYTESGDKPGKREGRALLETLRDRYQFAADAWDPQAERERADLRFQIAEKEYQWSKEAIEERAGRPTLCISQFDQPLQLILNQERAAHLGINIHPLSETADNETAEVIQGTYRHIERKSQAHNARSWAFGRAVKAGRGSWRVLTEYNDKGVGIERFYQDIVIKRMLYETVLWDPAAQEPDFSDAKFCFVESWLPHDEYAAEYGDSSMAEYSESEWGAMESEAPGWTKVEKGTRSCRVVEYWRKEYVKKTIAILADGSEFEGDALELVGQPVLKNEAGAEMVRTYRECVVRRAVANGAEVLSDEEWNGHYIPIITMLGRELHPFDGERRMVGIIRNARGAQEVYNYAVSTLVERMALEPRAPWVIAEGGAEGHPEWNDAHRKMYAYLEYKPTALDNGSPAPPPFRSPIDSSGIAISVQALQQARQDFQSATSVFDPSLGRVNDKERSGRAVLALQQQSDASTSDFMLNLQVAMAYEAMVVLDLIPSIYDAPGRVTRILRGDDDKSEAVILNAPFMVENGRPVPVEVPSGGGMPQGVKTYNLREGVYGVSVSIGKSYQTRLDEGSTMLGEMLGKQPHLFAMFGDLFLRFQKWPGADEMAKRAAKVREMQFPGIGEGEDGQMPPEQMAAQVKAAQQQMQMMQGQIQQLSMALETDRAKQEAAILKAQMDNATKQQIASDENKTKLLVAEIAAGVKRELEHMNAARDAATSARSEQAERRTLALKHVGETRARQDEQDHEAVSQAIEHQHETRLQREKLAHDVGMAAAAGQSFEVQMDRGQEQGGEMSDERNESVTPGGDE